MKFTCSIHDNLYVCEGCHAYLLQIWVSSPHNASGYYGLKEEINDALSKEHFQATLSGAGDTSIQYARTGYLGFMIKAEDNAKSKGAFVYYARLQAKVLILAILSEH